MLTASSSRHRKPNCVRCATPWRPGSQVRLIPSPKTPHCKCSAVITLIHEPQSHSTWKLRCFYDMSKVKGSWYWFVEDVVGAGDLIWKGHALRWAKHGILKMSMAVRKAANSAKQTEGSLKWCVRSWCCTLFCGVYERPIPTIRSYAMHMYIVVP